ncbi:PACE efflux transporter [Roseovarius nanhaiticus]|nr:PACE efflux transporter [Roseovarius nanhaiticus]
MRTTRDRIRHAVMFEAVGLAIVIGFGGWLFGLATRDMSVIAVVSTTLATLWTYVYNLLFDRVMQARVGHTRKGLWLRVGHSVLFEIGLLTILVPFIALYLQIGLIEALLMDVAISLFYLVFAFGYNWLYDIVFPVPEAPRP